MRNFSNDAAGGKNNRDDRRPWQKDKKSPKNFIGGFYFYAALYLALVFRPNFVGNNFSAQPNSQRDEEKIIQHPQNGDKIGKQIEGRNGVAYYEKGQYFFIPRDFKET